MDNFYIRFTASALKKTSSHEREKASTHRADKQEDEAHISTHLTLFNLSNSSYYFFGP